MPFYNLNTNLRCLYTFILIQIKYALLNILKLTILQNFSFKKNSVFEKLKANIYKYAFFSLC